MNITNEQKQKAPSRAIGSLSQDRPQNIKQVIETYPLELCLRGKEVKLTEKVLKKAFESYGFTYEKKKDVRTRYGQYYKFVITPYTTNFAGTYYHIGILMEKMVFSKREAANKPAKKKKKVGFIGINPNLHL